MAVKKNVQSRASAKGAKKDSSPSGGAKRQKVDKASVGAKKPVKKASEKKKGEKKAERAGRKDEKDLRDEFLAGDDLAEGSLGDAADERETEARFVDATPEDEAEAEAAEAEARDLDIEKVADEALEVEEHSPADAADVPEAADIDDLGFDDLMPMPSSAYGDDFDPAEMTAFMGQGVLGIEERNAVIQEVKQRAEKNGGYVTYEELNQILPQNIVDQIQSERYLKILEALGVQVLREDDVKKWVEAKNQKATDPKARAAEMIEDPIRMYLHQMGQVQLLSRDEEVTICQTIEEAEVKTRDMFNRFLFAPPMYASLLDKLEGQGERFDRIVTDKFDEKRDKYMELIPGFRKEIKEVEKRLVEASSRYLATIARKNVPQATLRGADYSESAYPVYTAAPTSAMLPAMNAVDAAYKANGVRARELYPNTSDPHHGKYAWVAGPMNDTMHNTGACACPRS